MVLLSTCFTEWLMEYHQSRPGLKVLQQRIDEFIIAHEEKLEQVFFSLAFLQSFVSNLVEQSMAEFLSQHD